MMPITLCSLALAICCAGCLPPSLLANRDRPHRVAEKATVVGWCRAPESEQVAKCRVELIPGDVIIGAELLAAPSEESAK